MVLKLLICISMAPLSTVFQKESRTLRGEVFFLFNILMQSQQELQSLCSSTVSLCNSFLVTLCLSAECCKHLPGTPVLGYVAFHALHLLSPWDLTGLLWADEWCSQSLPCSPLQKEMVSSQRHTVHAQWHRDASPDCLMSEHLLLPMMLRCLCWVSPSVYESSSPCFGHLTHFFSWYRHLFHLLRFSPNSSVAWRIR